MQNRYNSDTKHIQITYKTDTNYIQNYTQNRHTMATMVSRKLKREGERDRDKVRQRERGGERKRYWL